MTEYFVRLVNFMTMPREEEKGATAVEYGLLVALIAAVIVGIVVTLGQQINDAFTAVSSQL
ncbi:Flp family type IVb pilin [Nocardioides jiangxiensis]|uniref:Flp family type IVb pilin n=1 Tax=Nocardioides jiangxiensis TaxID=3064524 RepID=A0ABT9B358_9ACTN|nr:Flp family type IVb pilin [Nocardioides sp. WY-20]MDO7869285.1 Flp family type IVb pilin [Nocardioides sp. WY-20]